MKIEHIALYVNDLEAAKDFFVRYFDAVPNAGYHNPRTDFRSYFLTFADGARLELMNKPGMSDEPEACRPHRIRAHRVQRRQSGEGGCADGPPQGRRPRSPQRPPHHRRRLLRKLCPCGGRKSG